MPIHGTDRQINRGLPPGPAGTSPPDGLLEAVAAGDENLWLWCIRNFAAVRVALILEGIDSAALARGVERVIRELADMERMTGKSQFVIGDKAMGKRLGVHRTTAGRWIDAGAEFGIIGKTEDGPGHEAELSLVRRPILLRVRAAAAGKEIEDRRLWQPFDAFGPVARRDNLAGNPPQPVAPCDNPVAPCDTFKEEKEYISSSSFEPVARQVARQDGPRGSEPEALASILHTRPASAVEPKPKSAAASIERPELEELLKLAGIYTPAVLLQKATANGWTREQITEELLRQKRLADKADDEWPHPRNLVFAHLTRAEPGAPIDDGSFRSEYVRARRAADAGAQAAAKAEAETYWNRGGTSVADADDYLAAIPAPAIEELRRAVLEKSKFLQDSFGRGLTAGVRIAMARLHRRRTAGQELPQ